MKYDNEHAEYLFGYSGGAVWGDGDVAAPSGWFAEITLSPSTGNAEENAAYEFYGSVHLIIQEDSDGNTYVHSFPDQQSLNERLLILERAWRLWDLRVADEDIIAMHRGFNRAMAESIGMPGIETEWSVEAQSETLALVSDWIMENHADIVEYRTLPYSNVYGHETATWEDVGVDFARAAQRQATAFTDRVGAVECAAELNRTAQHVPPLPLSVVGGVIEVVK